jgi:hypothetical protein
VRLQQFVAVWSEERDPIAMRKPTGLKGAGEPLGPLVELGPGQPVVTIDDRDPVGKRSTRPRTL